MSFLEGELRGVITADAPCNCQFIFLGKRVSKIRPEFIIYDPQLPEDSETGKCSWHCVPQLSVHLKRLNQGLQEVSEAETTDEETSSPRGRRRRHRR